MIGSLVAFPHHGDWRLGVVKRDLGRKTLILSARGEQFRPMSRDISPALGAVPDGADLNTLIEKVHTDAEALASALDVSLLWELCVEGSRVFALSELSELAFQRNDAASCFALYTVLNRPQSFFHEVDGGWEPRSRQRVEEIQERTQRVQRVSSTREEVLNQISQALDHPQNCERVVKELLSESGRRHILERLEAVALIDTHEDFAWAMDLVRALEEKRGVFFSNKGRFKIVEIMIALGLWDAHENLHLKAFGVRAHSAEVLLSAQIVAESGFDRSRRTNLTQWWTVSIDSAETLDVDDALSLRALDAGGWEIGVHIADVSARVASESVVDRDARRRGVSVYAPEGVFPMIPRVLSEWSLSLTKGEERPALSLIAQFDEGYELVDWRFEVSTICVDRHLSYDDVDASLSGQRGDADDVRFVVLNGIAEQLGAERQAQGAVTIGMPESRIRVKQTDDGPVIECVQTQETDSHLLVQEYMVLYNHLAAVMLENAGVAASFRVQEAPEEQENDEDVPEGIARAFARLKQMRKADVSFAPGWHAGLGVRGYTQTTSPIRRYGDLTMQRQMKAILEGQTPLNLAEVTEIVSDVERSSYEATLVERQSRRYWSLMALAAAQEPIDAVVLDGATIFLPAFGLRVPVNVRGMAAGAWAQVSVEHVDARQDELVLSIKPKL